MAQHSLRISGLADDSIVDGPGLRLVIFAQGCERACPGCHNPETHDPLAGRLCPLDEILELYRENPLLDGVTFSGGEPFLQALPFAMLGAMIHELGGTVITYTGYIFEDLVMSANTPPNASLLLAETDLLVDGPYIESLASLDLDYRGSSNQRLLDREDRKRLLSGLPTAAVRQMEERLFPPIRRKAG